MEIIMIMKDLQPQQQQQQQLGMMDQQQQQQLLIMKIFITEIDFN
jgi:hypothetical protein